MRQGGWRAAACPGMEMDGFNMSHYQLIKDHVRKHGPDSKTPGLVATDYVKVLNVV